MKVDVIVGCQYGSEGKGHVAGFLAGRNHYDWLISVNSAQAGHTVPYKKFDDTVGYVVTRQLPASCIINKQAKIFLGAGAVINMRVLKEEIQNIENNLNIPIRDRLFISDQATVIEDSDIEFEQNMRLKEGIGSTCEGVGSAISKRAMRLAKNIESFIKNTHDDFWFHITYVGRSSPIFLMSPSHEVLIEGSQGFGLSLFSSNYPFCTSRDTTTAAFLSYAQISPRFLRDVYGVYRTYPIRVGGNSGDMFNEISWEELSKRSGYDNLSEITTVTKRVRRVGDWDDQLAYEATIINGVNKPILTFANYWGKHLENTVSLDQWGRDDKYRLTSCKNNIRMPFWAISTSKEGGWIMMD